MDDFASLKEILKSTAFEGINPVFGLIIKDWENIVGKKFSNKTEPTEISSKFNKTMLFVQASSSAVVQELTMLKTYLINKINKKYNTEITDLVIRLKEPEEKVSMPETKPNIIQETFDERPSEEDLEKIDLPEDEIKKITDVISSQPLDDDVKKHGIEIILRDLKTQEWMRQKGFPICEICGRVLTKKNFKERPLCDSCKKDLGLNSIKKIYHK